MSVPRMTVAARVADVLAPHLGGLFGVMGNGNAYLIDELARRGLEYTAVRHEAGGVAAADAFARAGGGLAAATTTYGPGFTNALTPLAEAARARIPLLLLTGSAPTTGPRPWDADQTAAAAAVGAPTITVGRHDAGALAREAVERALASRAPVVLALPYDLATEPSTEAETALAPITPPPAPPLDAALLDEVASALVGARRPLLLAGRGAWLAGAETVLGALADATGALTVTTALGRGVFPDDRHDLGVAGGFGAARAMGIAAEADVAIVLGASLTPFTRRFGALFGPEARVVQVDRAPAATHPRVDVFVRGDVREAAEALAERVGEARVARPVKAPAWRDEVDAVDARQPPTDVPELAADGRLDPRALAIRLGELLPADRVVVMDGGHFFGWANAYWPVAAPDRSMMVGTAFQAIGLGLPCVAGAARAKPASTVALSAGDGGTLMALADLETAVRVAGGRGMAVIWNDAAYAAEVHHYGVRGLDEAPMRIPEADFAALARAVGAEGVTVSRLDDLERLRAWRDEPADRRRFLLLDCRISATVVAPFWQEIVAQD
jgi:acetolactate synthase I/II/III large subunit